MKTRHTAHFLLLLMAFLLLGSPRAAAAQDGGAEVFAAGLNGPLGLAIDTEGRLWVAEQGTGQDDGRVSVITADGQVHAFIEGLPSETDGNETSGPTDVFFDPDGRLVIIQGEGTNDRSMSLLTFDVASFTPGDAPHGPDAAVATVDLGTFVLAQPGVAESNPYRAVYGPDGDLFIVDAAANALVRHDADTGELSLFARFDDVANPTPVGPPFFNAVPTGLAFTGEHFLVASLTGFPFPEGAATVYRVDLQGEVTALHEGLTALTDLTLDPADGQPIVSSFATFSPASGFMPGTGTLHKLHADGTQTELAAGLNLVSSVAANDDGDLFIGSLFGMVLRVAAPSTDTQTAKVPTAFTLEPNYPNPFNPRTTLRFTLPQATHARLTVYNALGQAVRTLVHDDLPAGVHSVTWDGRSDAGVPVPSGAYVYRLEARGQRQSRMMLLVK